MSRFPVLLTAVIFLTSAGCYHARIITTDYKPSTVVYEKAFASSWVLGLVPPKEIDATEHCPDGVASVETELSFVNQLVGILTSGIYTPMHITVTCGEPGSASVMPKTAPMVNDAGTR